MKHGLLRTDQIYEFVESVHPDLCDDSIECNCGGIPTGQPEWKHQVRWAQQDLKNWGEIELVEKVWKIR